MATTEDVQHLFELAPGRGDMFMNDLPVLAAVIIPEGAAVSNDAGVPGNMDNLAAGEDFRGFAARRSDNSSGLSGAKDVVLYQEGTIQLSVATVADSDDVGAPVYASDNNTFTLVAGGNSKIGDVLRFISGTLVMVHFYARQIATS